MTDEGSYLLKKPNNAAGKALTQDADMRFKSKRFFHDAAQTLVGVQGRINTDLQLEPSYVTLKLLLFRT